MAGEVQRGGQPQKKQRALAWQGAGRGAPRRRTGVREGIQGQRGGKRRRTPQQGRPGPGGARQREGQMAPPARERRRENPTGGGPGGAVHPPRHPTMLLHHTHHHQHWPRYNITPSLGALVPPKPPHHQSPARGGALRNPAAAARGLQADPARMTAAPAAQGPRAVPAQRSAAPVAQEPPTGASAGGSRSPAPCLSWRPIGVSFRRDGRAGSRGGRPFWG